jgi:hypothetical protein
MQQALALMLGMVILLSTLVGSLDLIIEAATNCAKMLRFTAIALRNLPAASAR